MDLDNLLSGELDEWRGAQCHNHSPHRIYHGQVENGLVFAEPTVGNDGAHQGTQVHHHGEAMEEDCRGVIVIVQLTRQIQHKNCYK